MHPYVYAYISFFYINTLGIRLSYHPYHFLFISCCLSVYNSYICIYYSKSCVGFRVAKKGVLGTVDEKMQRWNQKEKMNFKFLQSSDVAVPEHQKE